MYRPAIYRANSRIRIPELGLKKLSAGRNEAAACVCVTAMAAQRAIAGTAGGIGKGSGCDI